MRPILDLLKKRDANVWSLSPSDSVFDALQQLANHNVGAMMVMDQGRLVGVFSERDYTRKIALAGKSSRDTEVRDIMTANVITVTPQTRTRDCMALMSQKKIRHLPIAEGDKVLGMISIRDIMDDIIADHELTISHLQSYIAS
ncbi:CBS domain-containing protein [Rhodoferax aquaticus]|uniref:CBS domain-containing protein n=1 Tax=Rhodoferax aquaticus TaxID=2527691 RepID=A0A515ELG7_9BURK|nr:CBS domain-containing protein [Rhodoferax aquaticus]QDL53502.1 CBS domain-containing protein [Rhodoferax aquaticus]